MQAGGKGRPCSGSKWLVYDRAYPVAENFNVMGVDSYHLLVSCFLILSLELCRSVEEMVSPSRILQFLEEIPCPRPSMSFTKRSFVRITIIQKHTQMDY